MDTVETVGSGGMPESTNLDRLYVQPKAGEGLRSSRARFIGELDRDVTLTELATAVILVGLSHRDEVIEQLRRQT